MQLPYSPDAYEAFAVTECALGVALTAAVWSRSIGSRAACAVMTAAVWMAVLAPFLVNLGPKLGFESRPFVVTETLACAAAVATLAMALAAPRWIAILALVGELSLYHLCAYLKDSDYEIANLHLAWFALLIGLHWRHAILEALAPGGRSVTATSRAARPRLRDDVLVFAGAMLLAALVGKYILHRAYDSADEWAYVFQTSVLAHGKAWVPVPECAEAHRAHWVFYYEGRAFSQYTPGWPLFLVPFYWARAMWLASPLTQGLLAVAMARLSRRATAAGIPGASDGAIRGAGVVAAVCATLGPATLLNGASMYCHVFVAAGCAWAIEATLRLAWDPLTAGRQWMCGAVVGVSMTLAIATRPPEGLAFAAGIGLVALDAAWRRRLPIRGVVAALASALPLAALVLVILHAQLGEWFKTGYSIAGLYYSWAVASVSVPAPNEWRFGFPLYGVAYSFWPSSVALGVLGLVVLRRRGAAIAAMLTFPWIILGLFYSFLGFGRYNDFGYGPRYALAWIVPMSLGGGAVYAALLTTGARRAAPLARVFGRGAGALLYVTALLVGATALAPLYLTEAHRLLHRRYALRQAIQKARLSHAVVLVHQGEVDGGPLLDTQNDPMDANPKVVVLGEVSAEQTECVHQQYAGWTFYRARGIDKVELTRE